MSVQSIHPTNTKLRVLAALIRIPLVGSLILLLSPVSPARADTPVCGPITVDTTWTAAGNNYVVTCLVHVLEDVTLEIQTGVRVYFDPGTSLRVDGELIAEGVTFGSTSPTPERGDWGRIYFTTTSDDAVFDAQGEYLSGSKIQGSVIVFGGGGTGVTGSVVTDGASPFLDYNTIRLSSTRGIYAVGRSSDNRIVMTDNTVIDNTGGGIHVSSGHLQRNTVTDNSASQGGGIYAVDSHLEDNDVNQNTASAEGGGIYASGSDLIGNTVSGNSGVSNGGGINAVGGLIQGNTVTGNSLTPDYTELVCGGGIHASGGTLLENVVSGNSVSGGFFHNVTGGAGICASLSTITDNTVTNNAAAGDTNRALGGGIYCTGSSVSENVISGNSVTGEVDGFGGGVYSEGGTIIDNTIESNATAGGTASKGGGIYGHINTLQENALTGNSANQGGGVYAYQATVTNNTILTNTTTLTGTLYVDHGTALGNTLKGNSAVFGGGMYGYEATLTGNVVQANTANVGGGIYASQSTVRGNTVTGNAGQSDGGGIYAEGGTVTENTVTGNTVPAFGHGSGVYLLGVTDFTYNSVLTNTAPGGTPGGISIEGQPEVQFNNLYGNQPYDVEVLSADAVAGTHNYWGLSLCTSIPWQIYDGNDLPGRGILSYAPSLYSPVPVAQLDAPTELAIDIGEDAVTLSWTPIAPIPDVGCRPPGFTDPDLVYHIWYSIGKPCGPYDGTGLPAGDSPIDAGEATSYVVNGLGVGDYYFVVASHDYLERESAFTNSVVRPRTGYQVLLPLIARDW